MGTMKRSLCILVVAVLLFGGAAQALEITPFNTYTLVLRANLSISSGKATVSGTVQGSSSSYSITGKLSLQRLENGTWKTIKTWTADKGTGTLSSSETTTVASGYTYRTMYQTNVNGENKTKYSAEKKY